MITFHDSFPNMGKKYCWIMQHKTLVDIKRVLIPKTGVFLLAIDAFVLMLEHDYQ